MHCEPRFHDKYIVLCFYYVTDHGVHQPMCCLLRSILGLIKKQSKLQRCLFSKHPAFKNRDRSFLERKFTVLKNTCLSK